MMSSRAVTLDNVLKVDTKMSSILKSLFNMLSFWILTFPEVIQFVEV